MSNFKARRYHDISVGHRVHGHEGKCRFLHGHNYRVHFICEADPEAFDLTGLDDLGRVIDFGVIKLRLCQWLEDNWDHKFVAWEHDPIMVDLHAKGLSMVRESIVWVPFNPTAENMAAYLCEVVAPEQLKGTGVVVTEVTIEETAKCWATYGVKS